MKIAALVLTLLAAAVVIGAQRKVTVFIAGDSTAASKVVERRPETGWGEKLEQYFDPARVKVVNDAQNGRSTRSFIEEGRWQKIVDALDRRDFVFVQFGHNDEKQDKPAVYASPADYKANLSRFIRDVRSKGATPVLMTPVSRRKFDKEALVKTHGEYPDAVKSVGKAEEVAVIDMEAKSAAVLMRYGVAGSTRLFLHLKPGENQNYPNGVEDNTHFSPLGAEEMAKVAVEGIRETKIKLGRYLKKY